jgi:hypothetical protein
MRDLRALANFTNLNSYRSWQREGFQRSGLAAFVIIVPLSAIAFPMFITLFGPPTMDARAFVALMGAALGLYLLVVGGLGLFAVLRLNAWKRAHPWSPPSPRAL